jgi:hypothetical protein
MEFPCCILNTPNFNSQDNNMFFHTYYTVALILFVRFPQTNTQNFRYNFAIIFHFLTGIIMQLRSSHLL